MSKEATGQATVGEAVGLVSAAEHARAVADVTALRAALAREVAAAGELQETLKQQNEAIRAALAEAKAADVARDGAVRETCAAKSALIRAEREGARLTAANAELAAAVAQLEAKGRELWRRSEAFRAGQEQAARERRAMEDHLDAALCELDLLRAGVAGPAAGPSPAAASDALGDQTAEVAVAPAEPAP